MVCRERLLRGVQTVHLRPQTDEFHRWRRTRLRLEFAENAMIRRRILRMIGREVARVVQIQTLAHIRAQVVGLDLATQAVRVREQQRAAVAAVSGLNCHLLTLDITQPLQCQQIIQSV